MLSVVKSTSNPRPDGDDIKELEAVCVFGIDNNKCPIKKFQKATDPGKASKAFRASALVAESDQYACPPMDAEAGLLGVQSGPLGGQDIRQSRRLGR